MIRPLDNWKAARSLDVWYWFPPISFLRRSILARKCSALVRADRMLSEADR